MGKHAPIIYEYRIVEGDLVTGHTCRHEEVAGRNYKKGDFVDVRSAHISFEVGHNGLVWGVLEAAKGVDLGSGYVPARVVDISYEKDGLCRVHEVEIELGGVKKRFFTLATMGYDLRVRKELLETLYWSPVKLFAYFTSAIVLLCLWLSFDSKPLGTYLWVLLLPQVLLFVVWGRFVGFKEKVLDFPIK